MSATPWIAETFHSNRSRLWAMAYRMLGSGAEADDAVQEAWLRLSNDKSEHLANPSAWLTTVTARICLDNLRRRSRRGEEPLSAEILEVPDPASPSEQLELAQSVSLALLIVLDRLTPAERIAFVLHDVFNVSFDVIGGIVDRSPAAARQLASRARRRVRGATTDEATIQGHRALVEAFLDAAKTSNYNALIRILDPTVTFRADDVARRKGAGDDAIGVEAVFRAVAGRSGAEVALLDGEVGAVVIREGRLFLAMRFTTQAGQITGIAVIAEPQRLQRMLVHRLGVNRSGPGRATPPVQ